VGGQAPFLPGFLCYNSASGPVAQLVEQRIENPRVGSSILPQATIHKALHVIAFENH
jgi:hypothetical protein